MAWGRVDDGHYRHRKLAELDEDLRKGCIALFWLAISWCNDQLTDGRVPASTVRMLGGDVDEADELVRVGLWEGDGQAYRVHDFLDFNKSRQQVEADRAQRAAAGAAGAKARWNGASSGESSGGSLGDSDGEPPSEPNGGDDAPSPVREIPDSRLPRPPRPTRARDDAEPVFKALEARGVRVDRSNGDARKIRDLVTAHGVEACIVSLGRIDGPIADANNAWKFIDAERRPKPSANIRGAPLPTLTDYGLAMKRETPALNGVSDAEPAAPPADDLAALR